MGSGQRATFNNKLVNWIDERLPVFTLMQKEYGTFPTPKNFNYFWSFGGIAMTMLILMILTGIFLAMHYTPHADMAFNSVEHIMRDVNYGWMLRYLHMNGASFFFIAVYIHIFCGPFTSIPSGLLDPEICNAQTWMKTTPKITNGNR